MLPYEKRSPELEDFRVESQKGPKVDPLGEEYLVYLLKEQRGATWRDIEVLDTHFDTWGGNLIKILNEISLFLNDKTSYKWEEIRIPVIEFWRERQRQEKEKDIAAGGKGQWAITNDFTLNQLMRFVSAVFGTKWEIWGSLPQELPQWMESQDPFERQLTSMAFDEAVVRNKITEILSSISDNDERARSIVQFVVKHCSKSHFFHNRFILDPEFEDEALPLSGDEEFEIGALWELYEDIKNNIENDQNLLREEKLLQIHEFWKTETGKRLNELNNRRVYGGTLNFQEKEAKKRIVAYEIARDLQRILLFWGLPYKAAQTGQKEYFRLYTKAAWDRERAEIKIQNLVHSAQSELKIFTELMRDEWDSNSLTFLGVVFAIVLAVFFGVISLIPNVNVWIRLLIALGSAIFSYVVLCELVQRLRQPLIRWSREILVRGSKK